MESVKSISLVSTYFKLWYLTALKINFVPHFFHNFANLLFWVLWAWLTTSTYQSLGQVDVYLHAKIDFISPFFLNILQKYYKFGMLGTLGILGYDHQKWWSYCLENFDVYLHGKNEFYPSPHSWNIAKILQTCYYGYFGHVWLWLQQNGDLSLKRIISSCKKSNLSLSIFFKYCWGIANLLFWGLWECLATSTKK